MVCAGCGNAINDGAKFCSVCGRPVMETPVGAAQQQRRLVRPYEDRKIAGVCAGIALYTGWDVMMVRLIAVIAAICGVGMPVLAYFIGWVVMPNAPYAMPYPGGAGSRQ
jgi:phage shock protein C